MPSTAPAPDVGSASQRNPDSALASILITATGLLFALLAAIGPFIGDSSTIVVRLPPDPTEVARVIPYRVTVAISEPPRQPFVPRPTDRKPPIVALAQIRDERELKVDFNVGGLLSEAGADHHRIVSDRTAVSAPPRWTPTVRIREWSADRTYQTRVAATAEPHATTVSADASAPVELIVDAPADQRVGFAADSLKPSDLDLWAAADPAEDSHKPLAASASADRWETSPAEADLPSAAAFIASDQTPASFEQFAASEPSDAPATQLVAADSGGVQSETRTLAEHKERWAPQDRTEITGTDRQWAEATRPLQATGDQWAYARSDLRLGDVGLNRLIAADETPSEGNRALLTEGTMLSASASDAMVETAPLGFDPADAVFVTALLPDWSEWDDAVRRDALRERALLRTAAVNPGSEAPGRLAAAPASSRNLTDLFDRHNFRLGGAAVVPALFIQRLPADLNSVPQAADRKALFLRALLPFVVAANERILRQRERIMDLAPLLDQGLPLGLDDRRFLEAMQTEFRVSRPDPEELLRRMDIVPPSLALAQAAEESGWGTSRPAREDNSLFGQMVFHEGGMRLREFESLHETVEAYIRNLNTHRAYSDFRQKRAQLRRASRPIDSHVLAGHIERYSERGMDYVATIRGLMTANGLRNFDDARLSDVEFLVQATAR